MRIAYLSMLAALISLVTLSPVSAFQATETVEKPVTPKVLPKPAASAVMTASTKANAAAPGDDEEKRIRFTFQEQDWADVIPWFANQTDFSLQPVVDYPEGSFTLKDDSEYTVLDALDQLNHALRIRQPEPYTIIRRRNMLFLWKLRDANFPNELIETVDVEDLDNRGMYEILSCIFDAGPLNAEELADEIEPLVNEMHRDYFAVFRTANQIRVAVREATCERFAISLKSHSRKTAATN